MIEVGKNASFKLHIYYANSQTNSSHYCCKLTPAVMGMPLNPQTLWNYIHVRPPSLIHSASVCFWTTQHSSAIRIIIICANSCTMVQRNTFIYADTYIHTCIYIYVYIYMLKNAITFFNTFICLLVKRHR